MMAESSGNDNLRHEQKGAKEAEGRFLVAIGAMIEHAGTRRILLLKRSDDVAILPGTPGTWEDVGGE